MRVIAAATFESLQMWWGQDGGLGEGQGCVCNVNRLKATDTGERRGPHPVPYPFPALPNGFVFQGRYEKNTL